MASDKKILKNSIKEGVVVCGSFYDDNNRNLCKVIIDGKLPYC